MDELDNDDDRARKERSPSFPFIPLSKAVERASAMAEAHRKNPARLATVAETWGYSPSSSGLQQTTAALKAFGLLEDIGRGDERRVVLSPLAWRILTDTRPGAKEQALREAAVRPRLLAEYLNIWLPDRPSDNHRLSELQLDRGFTPAAAKLFLRTFDDTMSFANLPDADSVSPYSMRAEAGEFAVEGQNTVESSQPRSASVPARSVLVASSEPRGTWGETTLRNMRMAGGGEASPRATLPLPEGIVALEIPSHLSRRSYEAVKAWVGLMVQLAEGSIAENENDKSA